MAISYTKIEVARDLTRDEVLSSLRENRQHLVLSQPPPITGADRSWFETTNKVGIPVNELVNEVYTRLISSGKANRANVTVNDSTIMNANDAYYPLKIKTAILEEIFQLIRIGVLIRVGFKPQNPGINFDFVFDFGTDFVMLTEYGVQFLIEEPDTPYFAKQYLDRLRQTAEPDEELKGYLSEGLACLRNNLGRAAAILLGLAAEHTLNRLIASTTASIQQNREEQQFKRNIRAANINIEERAEVTFRKLESSATLIPNTRYFRNMVSKRLRPAFHSIRDLRGTAAHLPSAIQLEEVRDHYTLYASSVYDITMRIIEYQQTL